MPVGRPISLTPNVATQNFTVTATADQTSFTVTGGYRLNELGVYRNGVRLIQGKDFTASDGSTVTLLSGAVVDDVIEFQIFDSFNIADAISSVGNQTISGELTATKFYGDGSALTGTGDTSFIDAVSLTVAGIATFNGVGNFDAEVTAAGGVDIAGGLKVGAASTLVGAVAITNTTTSTSTSTGALIVSGGVGIAKSLFVGENVSIGGTLTYEDVTNIDSVAVVTAGLGVVVTAGRGVQITAGGLNVDAGIGTFDAGISLPDDKSVILGNDDDLEIHHAGGSNSYIKNNTLALDIRGDTTNINSKNNTVTFLKANASGLMATTGILTATSFEGDGSSLTGVAATDYVVSNTLKVLGVSTFVGNNVTIGGTLTYEDVTNIDVIGIITARAGVLVNGGRGIDIAGGGLEVTGLSTFKTGLSVSGVSTFTNNIVATATTAISVTAADESSDTSCNVLFSTAATGNVAPKTGSNLTFNSSNGTLTATSFSGDGSNLSNLPAAGLSTSASTSAGIVSTLALSSAQDHKVTVSGVSTFTCSGGTEGESHTLRLTNSGITTVGFSTYFLFPSGSSPAIPTADGTVSLISFTVHRVGTPGIATQLLAGASLNFS